MIQNVTNLEARNSYAYTIAYNILVNWIMIIG